MSEEFTVHSKKNYAKKATSGILVIIIGVVLVFLAINMIVSVPANHLGIRYNALSGGVSDEPVEEGLSIKAPWDKVYVLDLRVQLLSFDEISVQTNDSQWLDSKIQLQIRISRENINQYFRKYGNKTDVSDMVAKTTQQALETTTTQYNVMDILGSSRAEVVNLAEDLLSSELESDGITLERLILVDSDAGQGVEDAIAREAIAKKDAETALYLQEKAEAEGQAKVIEAQKTKEANDILQSSLSENILRQMEIDRFYAKWDGVLPKVSGSAQGFFDYSSIISDSEVANDN